MDDACCRCGVVMVDYSKSNGTTSYTAHVFKSLIRYHVVGGCTARHSHSFHKLKEVVVPLELTSPANPKSKFTVSFIKAP